MPYEEDKLNHSPETKEEAYQKIQTKIREIEQDVLAFYENFPEARKQPYELPNFLNPYY